MRLIVLNGAPRSGKDTILNILLDNAKGATDGSSKLKALNVIPFSYKYVLCEGVAKRYSTLSNQLTTEQIWDYNADGEFKDTPSELFGGKSVRQALIYESEEVIKKQHGENGVAIATFKKLQEEYGDKLKDAVLISPDGGFESEMRCAKEFFNLDDEDVLLVRVLRDGCTFAGDSRSYISKPTFIISNNGSIDDLTKNIKTVIDFMKGRCSVIPFDKMYFEISPTGFSLKVSDFVSNEEWSEMSREQRNQIVKEAIDKQIAKGLHYRVTSVSYR